VDNPTLSLVRAVTPAPVGPNNETLAHPGSDAPASAARVSPPPALGEFGDYELLGEIARGGMGVVFRAREKSLGRVVALKMILAGQLATPEEVRRFRTEAEEASRLDHPNIVPIYHVGEHAGHHYFTMKLIEGGTLGDRAKAGRADLRQAAQLAADVAAAVHYAHQRGILHRDLKPGNILLDKDGRPHVTDFGLAKHLDGPAGQTQTGTIVGTPGYMSPEQAAGRKDLTTASDVYSVGAILYDLITGRPPFEAPTVFDVLTKVIGEEPEPPHKHNPQVDRDLETICLKCLQKDPRRRYASAEELARDLGRYRAGEPIQARPVSHLERARKWVRRRPVAAAVAAVLCAAALVLSVGGWVFGVRLQAALDTAEQNRHEAVMNATKLGVEREAALHRLEGLNDFLIYVNERLANVEGQENIRLEFLNEALKLSESYRRELAADPAARRHTARLYRCLGELWYTGRGPARPEDARRAQDAYARATALLEQLVAEAPGQDVYRADLAEVSASQAQVLQTLRQYPGAENALRQAIKLEDALAQERPSDIRPRQRAAAHRRTLGTFFEARRKPAEAEAAYREALQSQEQMAAQAADRQQWAATAVTLAWLLSDGQPAEARPLFDRGLEAQRAAYRAQPPGQADPQGLTSAYMDLAAFFKRKGLHAELPALGDRLRQDFPTDGEQTYNAACWLADAVRVVRRDKALAAGERSRLDEDYAAQAVRMLDKAIKEGYTNRAHMEADTDLDPLRPRPDFQRLMADLEKVTPSLTAEKELATLQKLVEGSLMQYRGMKAAARTKADQRRAEAQKPDLEAFAAKFVQLAQRRKESVAAIQALVWVLTNCDPEKSGPWAGPLRLQAVQILERDHFQKPEFANVCALLAVTPVPEAEQLLQAARERHAQREVRGLAGLALATSLAKAGEALRESDPAQSGSLLTRARAEFDRVVKDYAAVPYGRSTLGEMARYQLQEIEHLSVGSVAQEIEGEDLEGKKFKLSDYRGKVVVLDFWADWCGFCKQMYPQEQQMVRSLQGRPFALVGVNCDDNREAIRETVRRKGLIWRSWYDGGSEGGRICRDWHVTGYPTLFVLDAKGVIRYKGVRGPELDAAVAQLLQEAEGGTNP
jgi:thiol-disulfide isomerase/thioredoxin